MRKLERWLIAGLGALIVLAIILVLVVPLLERPESAGELGPGETETLAARVVEVLEEGSVDLGGGSSQPTQRLLVRIEEGDLSGQEVIVEEGAVNLIGQTRSFAPGDAVYLTHAAGVEDERFFISNYRRGGPLFWIAGLFVALVLLVGRGKGLRSLAGTLFSLMVIFAFVVPQVIAGRDPVLVSILGSVVLLAVSTYLVYGWNPKAHAAVAGMMVSLVLTGLLAWFFVRWAHLTGLSAEESGFLVVDLGPGIDLRGLLLGGIIIGSLGVLDDVCIGQASAVFELLAANRELGWRELFRRSLNIGRDHIAAMVNTLLLAYVGAAMPLMLVFTLYQEPFAQRFSREPIAEEVVRTLVGSIGLVLAVPITGLIASLLARWTVRRKGEENAG